jgi:hypothetical protein
MSTGFTLMFTAKPATGTYPDPIDPFYILMSFSASSF